MTSYTADAIINKRKLQFAKVMVVTLRVLAFVIVETVATLDVARHNAMQPSQCNSDGATANNSYTTPKRKQ